MKPFGRYKKVKHGLGWKTDYHIHDKDNHKVPNWWEYICDCLSRTTQKALWKKEVESELKEN